MMSQVESTKVCACRTKNLSAAMAFGYAIISLCSLGFSEATFLCTVPNTQR
jgi:hypothetical protein